MNGEYSYTALPDNVSAIWLLIDTGLSDHCLWLTAWADICITHWWQPSLILLAVPNYHHCFMQPGSQDSASLQCISLLILFLLLPLTSHLNGWRTYGMQKSKNNNCSYGFWLTVWFRLETGRETERERRSWSRLLRAMFTWIKVLVYHQRLSCGWRIEKPWHSICFMDCIYTEDVDLLPAKVHFFPLNFYHLKDHINVNHKALRVQCVTLYSEKWAIVSMVLCAALFCFFLTCL